MDKEKFPEYLKASLPLISQEPLVDAKTDKYHTILDSIMDKPAPLKKKRIKKDMKQPGMMNNCPMKYSLGTIND